MGDFDGLGGIGGLELRYSYHAADIVDADRSTGSSSANVDLSACGVDSHLAVGVGHIFY